MTLWKQNLSGKCICFLASRTRTLPLNAIGLSGVTDLFIIMRSPAFVIVLGEIASANVTIAASNRMNCRETHA